MAPTPDVPRISVIPLHGPENEIQLRLSPDIADEFCRDLMEEGLAPSRVLEFSAVPQDIVYLVGAGAPALAFTVAQIAKAIQRFTRRNGDKRIELRSDGTIKSITGFSESDVQELIATSAQNKRKMDEKYKALFEKSSKRR